MSYAIKDSLGRIAQVMGRNFAAGDHYAQSRHFQVPAALAARLSMLPEAATLHTTSGKLVWLSPLAEELYGTPPEVFRESTWPCTCPDDLDGYLEAFRKVDEGLARKTIVIRREPLGSGQKDTPQYFELALAPFNDEELSGPAILAISRDVTDRAELRSELEKWTLKARHSDREKQMAVSAIAHELGTPLNAIAGFAQLLQGHGGMAIEPEKQADYLDLINLSVSHLKELVARMRQETMLEAGHHELDCQIIHVEEEAKSALRLLQPAADKACVTLSSEIAPDLPQLSADPAAMRQILINLLSNAVKFTSQDGWVKLEISRKARWLVIEVTDNGIGMHPEAVEMLGQRYFRANQPQDSRASGTGLGLSIVYNLVELHGGRIAVESTVGAGSSFTIELPLSRAPSHPVPADPGAGVVYLQDLKPDRESSRLSMFRKTG